MRKSIQVLFPTLAAAALISACGSSTSKSTSSASETQPAASATTAGSSSATVHTASISKLGATVLVDAHGMTLYHLSGEQHGTFICTSSACIAVWHPLTASAGTTPTGIESLGTVKRPDGTTQITYKETPLYTFAQDTEPGQANGQGLKDVGTWTAVTIATAPASTTSTTETTKTSGGYAY
jgi:predicted lipoprotein with Yx(FWY)xxD motif